MIKFCKIKEKYKVGEIIRLNENANFTDGIKNHFGDIKQRFKIISKHGIDADTNEIFYINTINTLNGKTDNLAVTSFFFKKAHRVIDNIINFKFLHD